MMTKSHDIGARILLAILRLGLVLLPRFFIPFVGALIVCIGTAVVPVAHSFELTSTVIATDINVDTPEFQLVFDGATDGAGEIREFFNKNENPAFNKASASATTWRRYLLHRGESIANPGPLCGGGDVSSQDYENTSIVLTLVEDTGTRVKLQSDLTYTNGVTETRVYHIYPTGKLYYSQTSDSVATYCDRWNRVIGTPVQYSANRGDKVNRIAAVVDNGPLTDLLQIWFNNYDIGSTSNWVAELPTLGEVNEIGADFITAGFDASANDLDFPLGSYTASHLFQFMDAGITIAGGVISGHTGLMNDYRNPATMDFAIVGGDGAIVGDGFAEDRGAYTLDDADADDHVRFQLTGGGFTRLSPAFEITNWNSVRPNTILVDGVLKARSVDYNADVVGTTLILQYLSDLAADTVFEIGLGLGGTIYYVRTDGNDTNTGLGNSAIEAWRNIQKAADTMVAGDKVYVVGAPTVAGIYSEAVVPLNGGTAVDPITYEALGSVVLDGGGSLCIAFDIQNIDYIVLDGFEITNYNDCAGNDGNIYFNNSSNNQVLNCVIHDTGRDGVYMEGTSSGNLVHNNLIYNMDDDGITPSGGGNQTLSNNTIYNCGVTTGGGGWALEGAATAGNLYENNIFWHDIDNTATATYNYNDYISAVLPGTGNIQSNPLFIDPLTGDFHLSQIISGQGSDSPAVNAGGVTAASLGLDTRSTRTDNGSDFGIVDLGYHYPTGSPVYGISGTVYEDVNGDASLADAVARPNATINLYQDDGNSLPDASDTYRGTTTTDGSGNYVIGGVFNVTYWIVVDSKTLTPNAGLNGGFTQDDVWAEQTYGTVGARCDDGASGVTTLVAAAACYGGQSSAVSDNAAAGIDSADHITRVNVPGSDVTGVNFGFSFNPIVNTRDDVDDDAGSNRWIQGSLRQFIQNGNAITGTESSVFRIPTSDPGYTAAPLSYTSQPTSALPDITDTLVLDGTTQPDYPGTPIVELDGSLAGAGTDGLSLSANADISTIRGCMITQFSRNGIAIQAGADNITVVGSWIGTRGNGSIGIGNSNNGIDIQGASATIGGSGVNDGNVITNNGNEGINITGAGATGTVIQGNTIGLDPDGSSGSGNTDVGIAILSNAHGTTVGGTTIETRNVISNNFEGIEINSNNNIIQGNYIGTDVTGLLDRGNRNDDGVEIQNNASGNQIGGTALGAGNLIAFNQQDGVNIVSGTGNSVLGNRINENGQLGIDLNNDGVTLNDAGDGDAGANLGQNYPDLNSAVSGGGNTWIIGSLNSAINTTFTLEFFSSPAADPSSYGEGEVYLGSGTVTTDGTGNVTFTITLTTSVTAGHFITVTATDPSDNTSEFSNAVAVAAAAGDVILLVTPDATSLTAQDAAKKALIESWGYTVIPISAGDSQANFDAVAATAKAAYVSEEITSGDLGTKLRDTTIGVVNDEDALSGEFGFSTGFVNYPSDSIDITDDTHYITSPFGLGALTITTSSQSLHTLSGTLAPGGDILAEQPATANATLMAIDIGGILHDNITPAAGRRVYLPWGGGGFDINSLNANGQLLMRRALEWAASGLSGDAVTSAVAEIAPNDVTTGSAANAFTYDILPTIGGSDTGVDQITISVPGTFGVPTVTGVSVGGTGQTAGGSCPSVGAGEYCATVAGQDITVTLGTKVTVDATNIQVQFTADAPGSQDLLGQDFTSTVDDSGTGTAAQATTAGNADGDGGDANSWTVTTTDAAGCSVDVSIAASSDDAEEDLSTGDIDATSSSDLELIFDSGTCNCDQEVGLRFQGVAIPQGATITNAYIEFTADETDAGATNLNFFGQAVDNALTFSDGAGTSDITNRTKTGASVAWNNVPAWTAGEKHQSPNLADVECAGGGSPAVTSAVAEIAPNDVTTGSAANAFTYDILPTIGGSDTGVDQVTITVPGTFGAPTVTSVSVGGTGQTAGGSCPTVGAGEYCATVAAQVITVTLGTKVTVDATNIQVQFTADAPGSQDLLGQDFTSTVDDTGTGVAAQATTAGNADGDGGDANSWTVTTTDPPAGGCPAVDNVTTNSGIGLTLTISHTTSGTDRLLLVVPEWNAGGSVVKNVTGVTYNGIPLTRQGGANEVDDAAVDIWSLVNPPVGTFNVVITYDQAPNFDHIGGAISFTGVDQTTPLGPIATNWETLAGSNEPATVDVTSAVGELVFAGVAAETPDPSPEGIWQGSLPEHWHLGVGGGPPPRTFGAGATEPGAASPVTMQWTNITDHWAAAGISIKPSASCGTSTIAGTVFEDINYGGGDGRAYATADTSAQGSGWVIGDVGSGPNVVVELYEDQSGNFIKIADTNTDAGGSYSFAGLANGTYRIRVVNSTVASNRGSNGIQFCRAGQRHLPHSCGQQHRGVQPRIQWHRVHALCRADLPQRSRFGWRGHR
jgi:hypothetical protein